MSQIIKIHSRDHAFAMKKLNLQHGNTQAHGVLDLIPVPTMIKSPLADTNSGSFVRLEGRQKEATLRTLALQYNLPDLHKLIIGHYKFNYPNLFNYDINDPDADVHTLMDASVESLSNLRVRL